MKSTDQKEPICNFPDNWFFYWNTLGESFL